MRRWITSSLAACLLLAAPAPAAAQQVRDDDEPLEIGLEEEVDVQLVLVDFLVLDRQGRPVPDLGIDDFLLKAGGRKKPLASLDRDCPDPQGEAADVADAETPPADDPVAEAQSRRIVIVFDYFHIGSTTVTEAIDRVLESLDRWPADANDEHMLVTMGRAVRVETPFTRDLDDIRWALERMRNDPELYGGNHDQLTERRFFDSLLALFDLMELWPGRKAIVLFSGPFPGDGFTHDAEYRLLSALSASVRTSVYPVDASGLQPGGRLGGPNELRRIANETGGRVTADTNDIGLAYARAHRDLSCMYTLGFYDDRPRLDRKRRLTIKVRGRPTLRIVYPQFYVIRSDEQKRKSLVRTAAITPEVFESDELKTNLFVLGPRSRDRWRAVVAAEVRPSSAAAAARTGDWMLRGIVRRPNGTVIRSFRASIPAAEVVPGQSLRRYRELDIPPGRYLVSAVLSHPQTSAPLASTRPAIVSPIPRGEPFMIGPILGRRQTETPESDSIDDATEPQAADDEPEMFESTPATFEPLMAVEVSRGEPLDVLTVVCVVGSKGPVELESLVREFNAWDGGGSSRFAPVSARLAEGGGLDCFEQYDRIDTTDLPTGRYEMRAVAETEGFVAGSGSVEFEIGD